MKRLLLFPAALLALSLFSAAQVQQQVQSVNRVAPSSPAHSKATTEQQVYGQKLLELAEAESGALHGGMRAFANLRLARAFKSTDPKKAIRLLRDGFAATHEVEDDKAPLFTRSKLQVEILKEMVVLAPTRAEELLAQVDAAHRAEVLSSLLGYYEKSKQMDKAIDIIDQITAQAEFPYDTAASVMEKLTKDQSAEFERLFASALTSYKQHSDRSKQGRTMTFPSTDLGLLVVRFGDRLPANLVKAAILEILDQMQAAEKGSNPMQVSMGTANGAASFSSYYQYRLFELLPALRRVDPEEADSLLGKNQEVSDLAKRFPDGLITPAANSGESEQGPNAAAGGGPADASNQQGQKGAEGQGAAHGDGRMMMSMGNGPVNSDMALQMAEMEKVSKIVESAEAHPEEALANVATLQSMKVRNQTLVEIAQKTWKKSPTTAKSALKQLLGHITESDANEQLRQLNSAAQIYVSVGATDDAKSAVEKQLDAAAIALKKDTDTDDPNLALKAYWPSTNSYASALRMAGKIDPAWAFTLLKQMPDAEVRFVSEMSLAQEWLKIPNGTTTTIYATKNSMMMGMETED
jgi:hypothetical protein